MFKSSVVLLGIVAVLGGCARSTDSSSVQGNLGTEDSMLSLAARAIVVLDTFTNGNGGVNNLGAVHSDDGSFGANLRIANKTLSLTGKAGGYFYTMFAGKCQTDYKSYTHVEMLVKAPAETPVVNLILLGRDSACATITAKPAVNLAKYVKFNGTFQTVSVPLSAFVGVNQSKLDSVSLSDIPVGVKVEFQNIRMVNRAQPDPQLMVDSFSNPNNGTNNLGAVHSDDGTYGSGLLSILENTLSLTGKTDAYFYSMFPSGCADESAYSHVQVTVKAPAGTAVQLQALSRNDACTARGASPSIDLQDYVKFNDKFQTVSVPLSAFTGLNQKKMDSLVLKGISPGAKVKFQNLGLTSSETPTPKPSPTPTVTPKPSPTPTVTPKPSPTATPTPSPKPSATPTAPPSGSCKEDRGLWVWTTNEVLASTAEQDLLISSSKSAKVTDIYLYLTTADYLAKETSIRSLLRKFSGEGIRAWGLEGYRGYLADSHGPANFYAAAEALIAYNSRVSASEKFVGFEGDIEPQDGQGDFPTSFHNGIKDSALSLVGGVWYSSQKEDREKLMQNWVQVYSTTSQKLHASGLKFSAAMPSWTDDYFGEGISVTWNGIRQNVMRPMMAVLDEYLIMSYNTSPTNVISRVMGEITYGNTLATNPRIYAGIETHTGVGSGISYGDTAGKNTKTAVMADLQELETKLDVQPSFCGVNIHDWEGFKKLRP